MKWQHARDPIYGFSGWREIILCFQLVMCLTAFDTMKYLLLNLLLVLYRYFYTKVAMTMSIVINISLILALTLLMI